MTSVSAETLVTVGSRPPGGLLAAVQALAPSFSEDSWLVTSRTLSVLKGGPRWKFLWRSEHAAPGLLELEQAHRPLFDLSGLVPNSASCGRSGSSSLVATPCDLCTDGRDAFDPRRTPRFRRSPLRGSWGLGPLSEPAR